MDQLFYFSGSANKKAGFGYNEKVSNCSEYKELNSIKHWRRILSNFYVCEFVYNGKTYKTAEHAFQGEKIATVDKKTAEWFTIESGHFIGNTESGLMARRNRKLVILNKKQIKEWDSLKHTIMRNILLAKFSQNALPKKVLLLTKNAILLHGARGIPIQRQYDLEYVRDMLKKIT